MGEAVFQGSSDGFVEEKWEEANREKRQLVVARGQVRPAVPEASSVFQRRQPNTVAANVRAQAVCHQVGLMVMRGQETLPHVVQVEVAAEHRAHVTGEAQRI